MGLMLPAQIDAFLGVLQKERGRSPNTIAAYRNDLTQFSTYVQTHASANGAAGTESAQLLDAAQRLDGAVVHAWFDMLEGSAYAQATIARKQAAVTSFCQWLAGESALAGFARSDGKRALRPAATARSIDADQVEALLAHAAKARSPQGLRDNALLQLMVGLGIAASRVVALDVTNLHFETFPHTVRIGTALKNVPLDLANALSAYLATGRDHLSPQTGEDALFLNHRGRRLTRQGLWLIVKRLAQEAGLTIEVTPQLLRQSFALRQIEKGLEPKRYAEQMGTSPRRSSQDYRKMAKRAKSSTISIDGKNLRSEK